MRNLLLLIFWLFTNALHAQGLAEKEISSDIEKVTVFSKSAQITRKAIFELDRGKTLLTFPGLSPYIDGKSVQVKTDDGITVLSVNHQQNFLDTLKTSEKQKSLRKKQKMLKDSLKIQKTKIAIIKEKVTFLKENKKLGGKNESINVAHLREAYSFYSEQIEYLKLRLVEEEQNLTNLNKELDIINKEINILTNEEEYPTGEIMVKCEAENAARIKMWLTYVVGNAGWNPSYNIQAINVNEPVKLTYKANVHQNTKVDWEDVKLTFSSSRPNISGVAPELSPYYLSYNQTSSGDVRNFGQVSGKVTGAEDNEPLPGVNIMVQGTSIGTVTNANGEYSITLPENAKNLIFSFIGYEEKTVPINNSVINVSLNPAVTELQEVVVTGYGSKEKTGSNTKPRTQAYEQSSQKSAPWTVPTEQKNQQTSVNFEVQTPYTIPSSSNILTVDMTSYEVAADYQYLAVPKIDEKAYLLAYITDWDQYNLLPGEANIFFENTYIGKTLLQPDQASDSLRVSLGQDQSIRVKREKISEFSDRQFIGTRKEKTRAWRNIIQNNKEQAIEILVMDQVPVSERDEIDVEILNLSSGIMDQETGKITWETQLSPGEESNFEVSYSVKFPKSRRLIVE